MLTCSSSAHRYHWPHSVNIMGYLFKKHRDAGGAFGDAEEEERAFSSSSKFFAKLSQSKTEEPPVPPAPVEKKPKKKALSDFKF